MVPEEERETASMGMMLYDRRDHIPRMMIPNWSQYIRMKRRNCAGGRLMFLSFRCLERGGVQVMGI